MQAGTAMGDRRCECTLGIAPDGRCSAACASALPERFQDLARSRRWHSSGTSSMAVSAWFPGGATLQGAVREPCSSIFKSEAHQKVLPRTDDAKKLKAKSRSSDHGATPPMQPRTVKPAAPIASTPCACSACIRYRLCGSLPIARRQDRRGVQSTHLREWPLWSPAKSTSALALQILVRLQRDGIRSTAESAPQSSAQQCRRLRQARPIADRPPWRTHAKFCSWSRRTGSNEVGVSYTSARPLEARLDPRREPVAFALPAPFPWCSPPAHAADLAPRCLSASGARPVLREPLRNRRTWRSTRPLTQQRLAPSLRAVARCAAKPVFLRTERWTCRRSDRSDAVS